MVCLIYVASVFLIIQSVLYKAFCEHEVATNFSLAQRHPKFLAWGFGPGIVRFENSICTGRDGMDGTCYTRWQCKTLNGIMAGKCKNVGTCCVVQQSCGGSSSYNNTYFVNSGYPATHPGGGSCKFTIERCNPDICQVRIDFLSLTLAQPDLNGNCVDDALTITGGVGRFPTLCGENSGQHVYLDFNGGEDIKINIITNAGVSLERSWKFKIAQIECGSPSRAPSGCLMYYTDSTGTVRSFNYGSSVPINGGTRQIANTNYGVCIARKPGSCSISWSKTSDDSFSVTTPANPADPAETDCNKDYVLIPNVQRAIGPNNFDRYCGTGFTDNKRSLSTPFVLYAVTDASENGDNMNRGFSLSYTQGACGAVG